VNCPHCATPITNDARFCPACGKATAPTESGSSWPNAQGAQPDMIGRTIAGRYRIVAKLGEGGMGAVYRGEQTSLKRAVAIKLLKPELSTNQMILRRFNAEAEAVAKLSHPNTVIVYDFGQDTDGSLFIAMEYIEGKSLRSAIGREGPFSPARAIAIALQVAASLSDAHSHSIVHRDLKPDNVMLQERGRQKDIVRVLDFGIAKLRDENRATQQAMTQAGDMLGTPQYMAPEQIRGEAIDGRTDVYALGCMIYEMVTARLPYEAPTIMAMLSKHLLEQVVPPTQRRPDLNLPKSIDQLVLAAMAKDPKDRPPTMDQFSEMLAGLLQQLPQDPNRSSGLSPIVNVQNVVTPVAPSMHQAPAAAAPAFTPAPPAFTPAPIPPTLPVAQQYSPPPKKSSKAPLFAIIGALVAGGTGVGVWAVMKSEDKPTPEAKTDEKKVEETPTPTPTPTPTATDNKDPWKSETPGEDPWAAKPNGGSAESTPTPKTPRVPKVPPTSTSYALPSGISLSPPAGFKEMSSNEFMVTFANMKTGASMVMMPFNASYMDALEQSGYDVVSERDITLQGKSWKLTQLENDAMGDAFQQWALVGNGVIVLYQGPSNKLGNVEQVLGNSVRVGGGAKN
jgi:serine/threonine-protein kinase